MVTWRLRRLYHQEAGLYSFEMKNLASTQKDMNLDDAGRMAHAAVDLDPGATFTCGGTVGSPPTLTPGRWYLAAIADDGYVVDELDRSGSTRVSDNGRLPLVLPRPEPQT
jgi:hypothetical protein